MQAVTVLVRDVKIYKLEQTQLQVLLTFCEEDLYDYNRQSTAFSLLKVRCYNYEVQQNVQLLVTKYHMIREKTVFIPLSFNAH